jgi:hypothetical protein
MESVLIQFKNTDDAQKFIKRLDIEKHGASSATAHESRELAKLYIDIAILRGDVIKTEDIRNKLYDSLPSGEIDAFVLIKLFQKHISDLDELIISRNKHKKR